MNYVTLPNGRKVSVGEYVRSWKTLKTLDPKTKVSGFSDGGDAAAVILYRLQYGIHDRINKHVPGYNVGRNWTPEIYYENVRLSRETRGRNSVRNIPARFRERLSHMAWED